MTGYERVRVALSGRPPDRVPIGEFSLTPSVAAALLGQELERISGGRPEPRQSEQVPRGWSGTRRWEQVLHRRSKGGRLEQVPPGRSVAWRLVEEAVRALSLDAVGVIVGADQTWAAELRQWAGRDLFVWAVVDGPWQGLARAVGWSQALVLLSAGHGAAGLAAGAEAEGLLLMQLDRTLAEAARALAAGADGVVMGEDVAYAGGLLLAPAVIRERFWPVWREVTRYCAGVRTARGDRPLVCFHSDGTVGELLPLIRRAGFDAVHSLEPEAGMDAVLLVERYRGELGLWGGLSVDLLVRGSVGEIAASARRLAGAGRDGGLVLGTSSGIVPEGVPTANLLAAYQAVAPI